MAEKTGSPSHIIEDAHGVTHFGPNGPVRYRPVPGGETTEARIVADQNQTSTTIYEGSMIDVCRVMNEIRHPGYAGRSQKHRLTRDPLMSFVAGVSIAFIAFLGVDAYTSYTDTVSAERGTPERAAVKQFFEGNNTGSPQDDLDPDELEQFTQKPGSDAGDPQAKRDGTGQDQDTQTADNTRSSKTPDETSGQTTSEPTTTMSDSADKPAPQQDAPSRAPSDGEATSEKTDNKLQNEDTTTHSSSSPTTSTSDPDKTKSTGPPVVDAPSGEPMSETELVASLETLATTMSPVSVDIDPGQVSEANDRARPDAGASTTETGQQNDAERSSTEASNQDTARNTPLMERPIPGGTLSSPEEIEKLGLTPDT